MIMMMQWDGMVPSKGNQRPSNNATKLLNSLVTCQSCPLNIIMSTKEYIGISTRSPIKVDVNKEATSYSIYKQTH